jgi:hypothetical protein
MKIYINHFNLLILPNLIKTLSKYKVKSEEFLQLYSPEGIFLVDHGSTMKLKPIDHDISILENIHENITLIVDPSFYIIEKTNQIPSEHTAVHIKKEIYNIKPNDNSNENEKINKNKKSIKLVIEYEKTNKIEKEFNFLNQNKVEKDYVPIDIYFELPNGSNIRDDLVKEELIVFLSLLN